MGMRTAETAGGPALTVRSKIVADLQTWQGEAKIIAQILDGGESPFSIRDDPDVTYFASGPCWDSTDSGVTRRARDLSLSLSCHRRQRRGPFSSCVARGGRSKRGVVRPLEVDLVTQRLGAIPLLFPKVQSRRTRSPRVAFHRHRTACGKSMVATDLATDVLHETRLFLDLPSPGGVSNFDLLIDTRSQPVSATEPSLCGSAGTAARKSLMAKWST